MDISVENERAEQLCEHWKLFQKNKHNDLYIILFL